uniref:RLR CTR domain-containing protein n=1 Tax=Parastrongyloides trichosuri TaxID=131310 RepID=A0A0N4Z173_PARTI
MAFEGDFILDPDNLPISHFYTYKYEIIEYYMMPNSDEWLNKLVSRVETTSQIPLVLEICTKGRFEVCKKYYEEFSPNLDKKFIIAAVNSFPNYLKERALLINMPACGLNLYSQLFSKKYDERLFEKILLCTKWYDVFDKFNENPRYKKFCQMVKEQLKNYPGISNYLGCVFLRELPFIDYFKNVEENWFYDLRVAFAESDFNRAILIQFNPDFIPFMKARKLKKEAEDRDRKKRLGQKMCNNNIMLPDIPEHPRIQSSYLDFLPEISKKAIGTLQPLKSYQLELVSAVDGDNENHVIWAPEKAGKMSIISHIAVNHFQLVAKQQKMTRMLLLVPHFKYVRDYTNYLRGLCSDLLNIDGIADYEKNFTNNNRVMAHDLVILSGQMFLDLLKVNNSDFKLYFQDFGLIFMDYCEVCLEGHAYQSIIRLLKENKYTKPKIIGITETLGKHLENNEQSSMDSIADLCTNFDCNKVDIVRRNIDDFYKDVPRGFQEIVFCLSSPNFFHQLIIRESYTIERLIIDVIKKYDPNNDTIQSRFPGIDEIMYENFCCNVLQSLQEKPENPMKKGIIYGIDYLICLASSLSIHNVVPTEYSFDNCLNKLKRWKEKCNEDTPLSKTIFESYNRVLSSKDNSKFLSTSRDKKYPLTRLEHVIRTVLNKNNKSKILIRVNNTSLALNIYRWLTNNDFFGKYDCTYAYLIESNKQSIDEENSDIYSNDRLTKFLEGRINVLITTDVCQENIDVSLVDCYISYNCAVTYTKCIGNFKRSGSFPKMMALIVSEGLLELDDQKLFERDRMINCVVEKLRKISDKEFKDFIDERNKIIKIRNKNYEIIKKEVSDRQDGKLYNISCNSCMTYICSSQDIGIFDNITNIVINSNIWSKVIYSTDKHYKYARTFMRVGLVFCKNCKKEMADNADENNSLGIIIKLRQGFVIKLTAKNIISTDIETKENHYKKGWCSIENSLFLSREISEEEYKHYCQESMCYDPDMHLMFMKKMSVYMGACRSSVYHKDK